MGFILVGEDLVVEEVFGMDWGIVLWISDNVF